MEDSSFGQKISQYEPVDDSLSSSDLNRGYWFVTHKVLLRNLAIAIFLTFDVLLIIYALSGFVSYLITGQRRDAAAVVSIGERLITSSQERITNNAPTPLDYSGGRTYVFDAGDGRYDFATEVTNPNKEWYVMLTYQYEILDGEPTALRTTFLLPGDRKFLAVLGDDREGTIINDASLKIVNEMWSRIDPHDYPTIGEFLESRRAFNISNPTYVAEASVTETGISEDTGNKILFTITNQSAYNYWRVPLQIALYRGGELEGIEETELAEFRTEQTRDVEIRNFVKNQFVDQVEVIPLLDVFDEGVYMQQ